MATTDLKENSYSKKGLEFWKFRAIGESWSRLIVRAGFEPESQPATKICNLPDKRCLNVTQWAQATG